ncbi:hypothetical protein V8F20_007708 [Naviculisporaceae sp. PSN 640]
MGSMDLPTIFAMLTTTISLPCLPFPFIHLLFKCKAIVSDLLVFPTFAFLRSNVLVDCVRFLSVGRCGFVRI